MTPLTAERVRYISAELAKGKKVVEIAAELKLDPSYVSRLKRQHINAKEPA